MVKGLLLQWLGLAFGDIYFIRLVKFIVKFSLKIKFPTFSSFSADAISYDRFHMTDHILCEMTSLYIDDDRLLATIPQTAI